MHFSWAANLLLQQRKNQVLNIDYKEITHPINSFYQIYAAKTSSTHHTTELAEG